MCTECSHLNIHTHRDTIIDGEHPTHTKGVLSALVIEDAFYHMGASSPRTPTASHRCVTRAHRLTYTQRGASVDCAHLALTKGVLSALIAEDAFYRMYHTIAETSCYHP